MTGPAKATDNGTAEQQQGHGQRHGHGQRQGHGKRHGHGQGTRQATGRSDRSGGGVDPVFLDRTGRRRRLFVAAGSAGGLLLSVAAFALVAGFTGAGPGSVPGWPGGGGADDRRVDRPESAVSVRPRVTRQPTGAPTTTGVRRTTAPATAVPSSAAAATAAPSPTASVNPHRRVPTHTPNPRKSKNK